ncbi:MAG: hypothetical protein QOE56_1561 [Solirubrobacterales bacterium]|nr:hypothetical protein [Solirubrobacterales bacterium]
MAPGYHGRVQPRVDTKSMDTKSMDTGARLLEAAFHAARDQGRTDWRSMTAAVLKNRILDLTDRGFREGDWGATSFRGFLQLFSNLVDIDTSAKPPVVRWIGAEGDEAAPAAGADFQLGPHRRIRDDLWIAVLDYSSGQAYFWDGRGAAAGSTDDVATSATSLLPTLTREDFAAWRAEFVEMALAENPMAETALVSWRDSEAGTAALPRPFRSVWIGELKGKVLSRLLDWFAEQSLEPPSDLVQDAPFRRAEDAQTEEMRELIVKCVGIMSRSQLEELRLPANVVLRVTSS